jgi:glycosyltransferase involved in cell wall biosynthesis
MAKLSVLINTKNEADQIKDCLESVQFADEIVVVDMASEDDTTEIAQKYTDQIHDFKDVGYVEPARNFGLGKTSHDWVLIIDADERVTVELKNKINQILDKPQADVYLLPRKNIIFGQWIKGAGWWPDYQVRLFKRDKVEWLDQLHSQPQIHGQIKKIEPSAEMALLHHNYQTVRDFVKRLNRYTDVQASEINNHDKIDSNCFQLISAGGDEFLKRYFAQDGQKLGGRGLSLSILQAFYQSVLAIKKWELEEFEEDPACQDQAVEAMLRFKKSLNYWVADYQAKYTSGLKQFYWRLRRYFKI